jgi:hypothetical protein
VAGATLVYGFVRPFIFNRSPKLVSALENIKPRLVMTSESYTDNSNLGFQLIYNIKF